MKFHKIEIRQMPGFEQGGFIIKDLCDGVNLVYGPNAAGKSTLAKAIQALLFPEEFKKYKIVINGWASNNGNEWFIKNNVDTIHYQCDGNDSESPRGLPSCEVHDRYYLALHELLNDSNQQFAVQILREAAGGYDLNKAYSILEFKDKVSRPTKLLSELKEVHKEINNAKSKQQNFRTNEQQLQYLEGKRENARRARDWAEWLKKGIEYQQAKQDAIESQNMYDSFPEGMENLIGNENEQLEKIKQGLLEQKNKKYQTETEIRSANEEIESCHLTEKIPEQLILQLRELVRKLQQNQTEIERLQRELVNAQTLEKETKQRLHTSGQIDSLDNIDRDTFNQFHEYARQSEILRANLSTKESLYYWLGKIEDPPNLNEVKKGIDLLERWINAAEGNGSLNYRWFLIGSLIAGGMITAGVLIEWFLITIGDSSRTILIESTLIIVGIVFFGSIWFSHPNHRKRKEIREEFEDLQITKPEKWNVREVINHIRNLRSELSSMEVDNEKATKWKEIETQIDKIRNDQQSLVEKRNYLLQQCGLTPNIPLEDIGDAYLINFVYHLIQWQQARDKRISLNEELLETKKHYKENQFSLQKLLSPYQDSIPTTTDEAYSMVEDLNSRKEIFERAITRINNAIRRREEADTRLEQLDDEYNTLFTNVCLEKGEENKIFEYCEKRTQFLEAKNDLNVKRTNEYNAFNALSSHSELRDRDRVDLNSELERMDEVASELESLTETIGGIRQNIKNAKNQNTLEKALAKKEEYFERLKQDRENNYNSLVGSLLTKIIDSEYRSLNLPNVFHHARKIYTKITQGRYNLMISNHNPPSFRAYDTALERGHPIEELSSGTRLQIMMSVRLAFVEKQEQGLKLPLLMDETLGNSDDQRAETIIDSALEICREGRQIFYFTAQHDEVGKWIQHLNASDIQYKTIDLAQIRDFNESEKLRITELPSPPRYLPPQPNGLTYEEYGNLLNVPEFNPWDTLGNTHIWHFIDSPQIIYKLLQRKINKWGQLKNLVEQFGSVIVDKDTQVWERAKEMSKVYDSLARCLKVGIGKKVDRSVLLESGSVSERFINVATQIVENVNGEPKLLIEQINKGNLSGFRQNKLQELTEYLKENGYIDPRPPLSYDDVCAHVYTATSSSIDKGLLNQSNLEKIIYRIYYYYSQKV